MLCFEVFGLFKQCLQMDVAMHGNYIKWMKIYEWMYNLCDYLTYQCVFFFSNNVGSYNSQSDPTIYNFTCLPWSYIGSQFWQPCSQLSFFLWKML